MDGGRVDEELSRALLMWTGFDVEPTAVRNDESRIIAAFGADTAATLIPQLKEFKRDFYATDARHTIRGTEAMGERAAEEFRPKHPEISEDTVQALAMCYMWDFK